MPNSTTPTQIQAFKPSMDPVTGRTTAAMSPVVLYQGVLPGIVPPGQVGDPNPPTTTPLPANYNLKLPTMATNSAQISPSMAGAAGATGSGYYWVCLRRPANLFAPVSATNPMVVVDSVRFSYLDGTGPLTTTGPADGAGEGADVGVREQGLLGSAVSTLSRRTCRAGGAADGWHDHRCRSPPTRCPSIRGTGTASRSWFPGSPRRP